MYVPKLQVVMLALSEFPDPAHEADHAKVHAAALAKAQVLRKLGHDVDQPTRPDVGNAFTNCRQWFGPEFTSAQVATKVKRDTVRAYGNKAFAGDGRKRPVFDGSHAGRKRKREVRTSPSQPAPATRTTGGLDMKLLASSVAFLKQFDSLESSVMHLRNAHEFICVVAAKEANQ